MVTYSTCAVVLIVDIPTWPGGFDLAEVTSNWVAWAKAAKGRQKAWERPHANMMAESIQPGNDGALTGWNESLHRSLPSESNLIIACSA
jgi:phage baseplate assembly protein gpV